MAQTTKNTWGPSPERHLKFASCFLAHLTPPSHCLLPHNKGSRELSLRSYWKQVLRKVRQFWNSLNTQYVLRCSAFCALPSVGDPTVCSPTPTSGVLSKPHCSLSCGTLTGITRTWWWVSAPLFSCTGLFSPKTIHRVMREYEKIRVLHIRQEAERHDLSKAISLEDWLSSVLNPQPLNCRGLSNPQQIQLLNAIIWNSSLAIIMFLKLFLRL